MNQLEQSKSYLMQYIRARDVGPWIVKMHPSIEERARACLQYLDGMAGDWRTDINLCTYYYPVSIDGQLIDLSTIEKVREFYKDRPFPFHTYTQK